MIITQENNDINDNNVHNDDTENSEKNDASW